MKLKDIISGYTGHSHVWLTDCGDSAIRSALEKTKTLSDKDIVLIPDMGGWFSYRKIPKKLGMKTVELKTDDGLLDLESVQQYSADASSIIFANPAGYFAEQDIKKIYAACNGRCRVIMDVSGSLGDPNICDGKYADILVGSFGQWKAVNAGYGGFISSKEDLGLSDNIDPDMIESVYSHILSAKRRLEMLYKRCQSVKEDMEGFDIIHRDRKGINVIVAYDDESTGKKIMEYCDRNGLYYVLCPNYIKVERRAVSIEIKRLTD